MNSSLLRHWRKATIVVALFITVITSGVFAHQAFATINTLTLTSPTGGEFLRGESNITWTSVASSSDKVSILLSKDDNTSHFNTLIKSGLSATADSYTWNTKSAGGSSLADGNTYLVEISDGTTGLSYSSSVFTVDNTAPTTTLATSTPPSSTGWYNENTNKPVITLTCKDNLSGCSSITYAWYSATTSAQTFATTTVDVSSNPASITIPTANVPQGDNYLVYYSQDNAVNDSVPAKHNVEKAHRAEFKVDTVAPSIVSYTLDGKSADAYINPNLANASTTIALTASEPVTWTTIEVKNGSGYKRRSPGTFGVTGTTTWDGTLSGTGTAPDGSYQVYYTITDAAGNETGPTAGPLTPHSIIVDTSAPAVSNFTSPAADAVYTMPNILTFTPTDAGGTGVNSTPITCGYSLNGAATTTLASCTAGTAITGAALTDLTDGRNTIALQVTDAAGNSTSTAPVSFVYDNNQTLTVSNKPSDGADFATIGAAVAASDTAGLSGEAISVYPGTGPYTENVTLDKPFTLESYLPATPATIKGLVTVASDNTTVKDLDLTNPSGHYAVSTVGYSHIKIENNTVHDVGISPAGNIHAIVYEDGSADSGDITISGNKISHIGNASGGSTSGIGILDSTGLANITGVTIDNNTISGVTADPAHKGAYGILVNHSTSPTGGSTKSLEIKDNTISGLDGLWAHAIGLEGNTPGAQVSGNIISGLTDHKRGTDDVGVILQDNTGAGSVTLSKNQFAANIIGVANDTTATTSAKENWWGSIQGPTTVPGYSYLNNPFGNGAAVSNFVNFVPWCTNASCSPLDSTAPTATLSNTPASPTNVTSTDITVGPAGDAVYYKYQFDGNPWSVATSTSVAIATSSLADGSHTLNVDARDQAGNWQTSPTTYSWTVDTVPPVLSKVTPVSTPTSTPTVSYVFNTTKSGTFSYGGSCGTGSVSSVSAAGNATTTFSSLRDGLYDSCTITETDKAGNTSNVLKITPFRVDTTAPSIDLGSDIIASTTVTENATVTDSGSGVASVAWSGPSGVTFVSPNATSTKISANADGVYTLTLKATDKAGNTSSKTMQFTWDTVAPTITAPADITKEAAGPTTSVTLGTPTVHDHLSAISAIKITNDAPTDFSVGTTTVTWTATDAAGNSATAVQKVGIIDTVAPKITSHANVTAKATSANGAVVKYTDPTATDVVDGTDTVTCSPASDSQFSLGTTTVACSATDAAGNTASTTFKVIVQDTTAPVIASHANMTVTADQLGGATVNYTAPTSTDAVDGTKTAVCTPAPGATFKMGTNTVNCTQTDAHGNAATPTSFTVTVNPGPLVQLGIAAAPSNLTTAEKSTITVTGEDTYGNTVTSDNSTIAVLSTDGGGTLGTTLLTLVNGASTTELTSTQPGIVHVNAASNSLTPAQTTVTFTGASVPDTTPPTISDIQATNIGTSTVEITWQTNENATSQVEYGTTSSYGTSTAVDTTLTSSHSVILSSLTPNTTYHFRVNSADAAHNLATSVDNTFATLVDNNTAVLAVNGIDALSTYAAADNVFADGWKWVFHVTVPTDETYLRMKFDDFTNPGSTIPVAGNLRFYSAQSSNANATSTAITINGANAYSDAMHLTGDDSSTKAGRQVNITVEMRVPKGSSGGSYSTSYGIDTSTTTPAS